MFDVSLLRKERGIKIVLLLEGQQRLLSPTVSVRRRELLGDHFLDYPEKLCYNSYMQEDIIGRHRL